MCPVNMDFITGIDRNYIATTYRRHRCDITTIHKNDIGAISECYLGLCGNQSSIWRKTRFDSIEWRIWIVYYHQLSMHIKDSRQSIFLSDYICIYLHIYIFMSLFAGRSYIVLYVEIRLLILGSALGIWGTIDINSFMWRTHRSNYRSMFSPFYLQSIPVFKEESRDEHTVTNA